MGFRVPLFERSRGATPDFMVVVEDAIILPMAVDYVKLAFAYTVIKYDT